MSRRVEMQEFYGHPVSRCPVRWWPTSESDRCPMCGLTGYYAGIAVKDDRLETEEDDGDEG